MWRPRAELAGGCLNLARLQHANGTADIGQDRQPAESSSRLPTKSVVWSDRPVTLPPVAPDSRPGLY
ncbi:MAG: hypothetical protein WB686_15030 [Pseudolabrys sp.]